MKHNCKHCMDTGFVDAFRFGKKVSEPCAYCKKETHGNHTGLVHKDLYDQAIAERDQAIRERDRAQCEQAASLAAYETASADRDAIAVKSEAIHSLVTAVENVASRLTEIDKTIQSLTHEGGLAVHCFKE